MKILIRNKGAQTWEEVTEIEAEKEVELQEFLADSPGLIPVGEIKEGGTEPVAAVCEMGLPGSGYTDIIGFSPDGDITVVECKLASNAEAKRKVIGQILEYGAYLWQMTYEEVNAKVKAVSGQNLIDLIEEKTGDEFDSETFREGVEEALETGSFTLVIVVDEINDELKRIIQFFGQCSSANFSLHALELNRFIKGETEILVPSIYGELPKPRKTGSTGSKRRTWTEDDYISTLKESVDRDTYNVIMDLYNWSKKTAHEVPFGTGAVKGSFTYYIISGEQTPSVFSVYTDGKFVLNYGYMEDKIDESILIDFHKRITQIPGFKEIEQDFHSWVTIESEKLYNDPEAIDDFKKAVKWLKNEV